MSPDYCRSKAYHWESPVVRTHQYQMDRRKKARDEVKHNLAIKTEYVRTSPRLKIPRVLVHLDHVASGIVNANQGSCDRLRNFA